MENTNNSEVRITNTKRVMNCMFRHGPMTKQELAWNLNMSLPTVNVIIKNLTDQGLVSKGEVLKSTGGRKATKLTPVYDARYSVGIEGSQTELRIVLVDLGINQLATECYPLGVQNKKEYWDSINIIVSDFIARNVPDKDKLLGVALALQIPMKGQKAIWTKNMPQNLRLDLDMVESCFDMPVKFYSSGKMAAISQIWALSNWNNFVFMSIGSYMSGAIIHNSTVIGFSDSNGEFGNMLIQEGENLVRMEDCCTSTALIQKSNLSIEQFFEKLEQSDSKCKKIWDEYLMKLSACIYNLHCFFDQEIVIGGVMSSYLGKYVDDIKTRIEQMSNFEVENCDYVRISDLGMFGAAIGAALTHIDAFVDFELTNDN